MKTIHEYTMIARTKTRPAARGPAILLQLMLSLIVTLTACDNSTNSGPPPPPEPEATFEGLGDLLDGDTYSLAYAVSADGLVVVGRSRNSEDHDEAFRWANGEMERLGVLPGGIESEAHGVSTDGSVVVGFNEFEIGLFDEADLLPQAFRWENGVPGALGGLPNYPNSIHVSQAYDVSANGSVVGTYVIYDTTGTGFPNIYEGGGFRWERGEMENLGSLLETDADSLEAYYAWIFGRVHAVSADGSVVVGRSISELGEEALAFEAFRWENGDMEGLGFLPGGEFSSEALDVSADGSVVVGQSSSANGESEAFRWENGTIAALGDLPGGDFESEARAVSANGSLIVGRSRSANGNEAFIWTAEDRIQSLQAVLENEYNLDLTGWILGEATGISDDGTVIVGYGENPDGNTEAWRAFLGEPVAGTVASLP